MQKTFIVVFVTALAVLTTSQCRVQAAEPAGVQVPAEIAIMDTIQEQIDSIKSLSVPATLRLLDNMKYYSWPGAFIGAGHIALVDINGDIVAKSQYEYHKIDLEKVLSNRVFRKALQDLGALPKDQAEKILKAELEDTLSKYIKMYDGFFKTQSLAFAVESSKDGQPVLTGLRNKIYALSLIAGTLELTGVHDTVKKILVTSDKQQAELPKIKAPNIRSNYAMGAALKNNIILASGLYGTSPKRGGAGLGAFAEQFGDKQFVDFSAPGTEYDMNVQRNFQLLEPDKDFIQVRYFEKMTDEDMAALRQAL